MKVFQLPSPIQKLRSSFIEEMGVTLCVKRDDLIHTEISGNKWRKLKYNLEEAERRGIRKILTFGGAYSNHIAATAAAGRLFNFNTIGVIRGEEGFENKTLIGAKENGMELDFVSRLEYKRKGEKAFLNSLARKYGQFYLIPEGGANEYGVKGCEEIISELDCDYDYVLVSAGTGTTAAGILRGMNKGELMVFPALKGGSFIREEIKKYSVRENISLHTAYHFGGYGKTKPEQLIFMKGFYKDFGIELDKVYTSKLFFGLFDLLQQGYFKKGSTVLVIHTGGLQGN